MIKDLRNSLYARRESDFKQLFMPQYKSILLDVKHDIYLVEEDCEEAKQLGNHMEYYSLCNTLAILQTVKKQYETLIQSSMN